MPKKLTNASKVPFFTRIPYGIKKIIAINAITESISLQEYVTKILVNHLKESNEHEELLKELDYEV